MKSSVIVLSLSLAGSATALSAPETYTIDPNHTFPSFEVSHFGYSLQRGRFDKTSGTVVIDRAAKSGSIEVSIDAASVDTGFDKRDEHLRSPEFFSVAKFPTITFKSARLIFKGDTLSAVDGELTLLGVTRPATLAVDLFKCAPNPMMHKDVCGANATLTIKRSDFGMSTFVPNLGDEVRIAINIEAAKG